MTLRMPRIPVAIAAWAAIVSGAHMSLNVDWASILNERRPIDKRKLNVAYIPVT